MITLTDMFCGCGGSSQGAKKVAGVEVKLAMNHWRLAVDSHNTNHPDTDHDCADISETHPARYGRTTGLIASPECTNHSLAKGIRRKNLNQGDFFQQKMIDPGAVRSRATMWDVVRFAEQHRYEFIIIENVVDVRYWELFDPWLKSMHALGYNHKCVYLNAQFVHGDGITGFAPQSRDRIYIVFWKKGNPTPDLDIRPKAPCPTCGIVAAVQNWKNGRNAGKYKMQYVYSCTGCGSQVTPFYYAALNALDLSLPMVRIGDRKKPLSPNTIARIEYGLKKYGAQPTILDQAQPSGNRIKCAELEAMTCQTTRKSSYLFSPFLFNTTRSHAKNVASVAFSEAMSTLTAHEELAMVTPFIFDMCYAKSKADRTKGVNDPFRTQTTHESLAIATAGFMPIHRTDPLATVSSKRTSSLVIVPIHGTARAHTSQEPLHTQMTTQHSSLILMPYHGGSDQACTVLDPSPTIPTRDSLSLVDSSNQVKVEDCYFRMLQPDETARAQGFPMDYVILGNKDQRQKQIGNANPPPTMELLVARCAASLT